MTETDMGIALDKLSPTDNDVIVVKVGTEKYTIDKFGKIFRAIKDISPCPVIAIPEGIELQIDSIDYMINYLQSMKKT